MRERLKRFGLLAVPLVAGFAIGVASCQLAGGRADEAIAQDARPPRAEKPRPARAAAPEPDKKRKPRPAGDKKVLRVGSVVGLNREDKDEYVILHKYVWPEILDLLRRCNIRNYSIYLGELNDGELYLFSYFEYTGDDLEADLEEVAKDPAMRAWWRLTDPLQKRVRNTPTGEQWKRIEEVFHTD